MGGYQLSAPRILAILGIGLAGVAVVLAGMIIMNRVVGRPEPEPVDSVVNFTVPPPPPPEPTKRREPTPRRLSPGNQLNLAPLPNLGTSLSGIQVALPGVDVDVATEISESVLGDLESVALTEDSVDSPPSYRSRVVPEYPRRAQQRDLEGSVLVSALVGIDGRVKAAQILESIPPGVFDEAVLAALQASVFEPATYQGNPVETWVEIPYPFRLN